MNFSRFKNSLFFLLPALLLLYTAQSQQTPSGGSSNGSPRGSSGREKLLIDSGWRFAFGHPSDVKKDFDIDAAYFSYYAKAGYGGGAASIGFDDRAWRKLDLPHDWAVEQPFDPKASFSHGFKAIGPGFPDASVGWYRKSFQIPASDLGRRITIAFDGVFRDAKVWVNGQFLGNEPSGYLGFEYNISEYLNYGGENVVTVRVDASREEGWFYEGAGIYRHVWLTKTNRLHVATDGTYVTTQVQDGRADISCEALLNNDDARLKKFIIQQDILDQHGQTVGSATIQAGALQPFESKEYRSLIQLLSPQLWSVDSPQLYSLVTSIIENGVVADTYTTHFGIRTLRFDANEGFFLNGQRLEIKGTNNHQDHAGVGTAMPDALQDYRIKLLKELGSNAYRCSHNPPTPELLDACDRLGMLVIDENRLMGVTSLHLYDLKRMVARDRNHPSIISWSIGNEEWGIENSVTGARIATTMQAYAKNVDSTRPITAAFSGGWGQGLSAVMDLIGYNYIAQENPDAQHRKFPLQKGWGTEEGSTHASRGVYYTDSSGHQIAAYDAKPNPKSYSIEEGWNFYIKRPFLAGMFIWTGFDYRGEPTPFGWPSINSYFGMLDVCGFPKDDAWYLQSWWTDQTVLHILPHWNWKGREQEPMAVWVYSNCEEVELFLNRKSLGKKKMPANGHLEWIVNYVPGILEAAGTKNGKKIATDVVKTTGEAVAVKLSTAQSTIQADNKDISLVKVQAGDRNDLSVPTAGNEISFRIVGPGRIIGVGNGDPTSLEPDKYIEKIDRIAIRDLVELPVESMDNRPETAQDYDVSRWTPAFANENARQTGKTFVYRGSFQLPAVSDSTTMMFYYKSIGVKQSIYINGHVLGENIAEDKKGNAFRIDPAICHPGKNNLTIVATPLLKIHSWDNLNNDPGVIALSTPADQWKRKLFNGCAQLIIQSTGKPGAITLTAAAPGLKEAVMIIQGR